MAAAGWLLASREGIELAKEHDADREDGPQLDDDEEHVPEVRGGTEPHELVEEQHVARR